MPHSSTGTDRDTNGHFTNDYEDAYEVEAPIFTRSSFSFNQRSEMGEAVGNNEIKLPPSFHQNSEIEEMNHVEIQTGTTRKKLMDFIPVYIPAVEEGVIVHGRKEPRFWDFLRAAPTKEWFMTGQWLPRRRAARNRSQSSDSDASTESANTNSRNTRFHVPFVRKIKWRSFGGWFKKWIKDPSNIALFIWLVAVAIGLFMLFLIMIGALNSEIPSSSRRSKWNEVINQILNALFTIMCVYQHPRLFHHLVLLLRWSPEDKEVVRKIYSKGNWPKPRERATMLFVVFLLHLTCCAQYFCCALFWAYTKEDRPDWPLYIGYVVGIVAPIIAGLLTAYGPLARQREIESEDIEEGNIQSRNENHNSTVPQLDQTELMIYNRTVVVTRPEWMGGLFDCWDDLTVFFLSSLCTLCVFGWNMERLGMGNMYVHVATFMLLFIAPLLIFSVTALNIDDDTIRFAVGIVGIVLCLFALLYGGFWRIQMRKRFKLPGKPYCCGQPSVIDCLQWQFCWACSLAQEVRTGNFYDIGDDMFYTTATNEEHRVVLVPLPRDGASFMNSRSFSCPPKIEPNDTSSGEKINGHSFHVSPNSLERVATYGGNQALRPPLVPLMQLESNDNESRT